MWLLIDRSCTGAPSCTGGEMEWKPWIDVLESKTVLIYATWIPCDVDKTFLYAIWVWWSLNHNLNVMCLYCVGYRVDVNDLFNVSNNILFIVWLYPFHLLYFTKALTVLRTISSRKKSIQHSFWALIIFSFINTHGCTTFVYLFWIVRFTASQVVERTAGSIIKMDVHEQSR